MWRPLIKLMGSPDPFVMVQICLEPKTVLLTGLNQLIHKEVPYYGLPKSLDPMLDSFLGLKGGSPGLGLVPKPSGPFGLVTQPYWAR